MKNFEKYNEQLKHLHFTEGCSDIYKKIKKSSCLHDGMSCGDCELRNIETFLKFMNEEYVEPIQLSHNEYVILKNIDSYWKYISRNISGTICLYNSNNCMGSNYLAIETKCFDHLFTFIKFEDDEPYEIAKLIADYEKEHGDE
ncbi:hypothetical protein [Methanobrevibacter sp.]|uniref:hypothetical protein n=1 Tax=Methanobrevibacter sp. TaxID=66852 RepID=UPI00389059A3